MPVHPDLKFAGMLPPLDAPHHLRSTEWFAYREGVVKSSKQGNGSLVDVGLEKVRRPARPIWRRRWADGRSVLQGPQRTPPRLRLARRMRTWPWRSGPL